MAIPEEIQKQVLAEATSATPNYSPDYNSQPFKDVDASIANQQNQLDQIYGGMINNTDQYYNEQIQASKDWAEKQTQLQQEQTDFAIEKIEQQKDQAHKDYLKEQSGAYVDWQKQSNQYGTQAEKTASAGLANTGFSESSQVSMYNTYQNRVATARESFNNAVLNYNNAIKDAQLQNNATLAEIAYNALQQQLELGLQGFQYKNQLILEQANKKTELENIKWNRYQDILQQINTENALAEDIRQYNETQKWQTEQAELDRQHNLERDRINNEFAAKQAELDRKHDFALVEANTKAAKEKADHEHKLAMEQLKKEQAYALEQLDKKLANDKALLKYENSLSGGSVAITGGSGGSVNSAVRGATKGASTAVSNKKAISNTSTSNAVNTAYYSGSLNSDAKKYGTFSNGYQPKGISGHGALSKSGETITIKTQTLYGQKQTVVQNVWKAKDGTKWYWEGRQNKYIQIK